MKNTKEKTDSEYVLKKFAWSSLIYINTTDSNDDHKYGQIKRIHIAKVHVYVIHTVHVFTCLSFTLVSLVLIDECIT